MHTDPTEYLTREEIDAFADHPVWSLVHDWLPKRVNLWLVERPD